MQGGKEPELYEASVSETCPAPERHLLTEEKTEMFPRTRERFQMLSTHTMVSFIHQCDISPGDIVAMDCN